MPPNTIFTIGHSTRKIDQLIAILESYDINILVDVRSYPRSLTNPQFNTDTIPLELNRHKIDYVWLERLGGRRKGFGQKSKNTSWKNRGFRNYADYMEGSSFLEGLNELKTLTLKGHVAIMCAELLYWQCHRLMISDFLKSKGYSVIHIFDKKHSSVHKFTECARLVDGELTYHPT